MKKLVIAISVLVLLASVNMEAIAQVNVTLNYTADNEFTGFWSQIGGSVTALPLGAGYNWWPTADSYTTTFTNGFVNEFIWEIQNWGRLSRINPGGFLAGVTPGFSVSWDVSVYYNGSVAPSSFGSLPWYTARTYGANNDPSTIWNRVLRGPVPGIAGNAQWLWGKHNFTSGSSPEALDRVYIRANVSTHTPEPGTMLLLGSGLIGLGVIARIRRKRS